MKPALAQFWKNDPALAFGSLVAPAVSLAFAAYELRLAKALHPHLLNAPQSLAAVLLTSGALLASYGIACLVAPKVRNPKPFPRLLVGLGTGLGMTALASLVFSFLA